MEPINIVDYGHHTIKCGRVFAGKGAATKAARAAAAAGTTPVAHCRSGGMTNGRITDMDSVMRLIPHACNAAAAEGESAAAAARSSSLSNGTLVFLAPLSMSRDTMMELTQRVFEELKVKRFHIGYSPACALLAAGTTSGTVVDCGEYETRVVPVHDAFPSLALTRRTSRGGYHHSLALREMLLEANAANTTALPPALFDSPDFIDAVKMKCAWSCLESAGDEDAPIDAAKLVQLELPDGQTMSHLAVAKSRLDGVARRLFDVRWGGASRGDEGVPVLHALKMALREASLRLPEASRDVVLAGGPSLIKHTDDRVRLALSAAGAGAPPVGDGVAANDLRESPYSTTAALGAGVSYRPLRDRQNAAWIGASIMAQVASFNTFTVDRATYNSEGPASIRVCVAS
jgi:hypothetical protein